MQQIAATWRDGGYVAFPGASHFLHHEMSDETLAQFIATVQAFLARQ